MLRSLAVAFGFLTRIPVAAGAVSPGELARSLTYFPAVGAALGALLFGARTLLGPVLAPGLVAACVVALGALATGGLHLDGVADVFDALGGGRGQRDRMLHILRDSRIGAHGAAALALLIVAKVLAVAALDGRGWALYGAPIAARWAVVVLVVRFPYARPDGLGAPFHRHAGSMQLAGATIVAVALLGGLGARALAPAAAALGAALAVAVPLHRRLGGLTGDVYGAAIEAAELAFLVVAGC
ncbi:MAG TPA: adenosylcobinamide-GDP ribazoletransferase [Kofleriaceae bacterium]|nr:adenosylcobinamide-GDP ribazoletransferase [Kofleriaceae bacterium]